LVKAQTILYFKMEGVFKQLHGIHQERGAVGERSTKHSAMLHKHRLGLLLLIELLAIAGCSPKLEHHFATAKDISSLSTAADVTSPAVQNCQDAAHHIPELQRLDHYPDYQLRVNFHFIDYKEGGYNYTPSAARKMVASLLHSANKDLADNNANWLPYGNDYPVLPVGYQMVLQGQADNPDDDGIYFHTTGPEAFYVHRGRQQNIHHREVIQQFGIGVDSIMNIFVMPHHPDSVLSPTYHVGAVGVYLGKAIKMAGMYELNQPGWAYRGVLNHEMGHALGLRHAWLADGCADTPTHHNNCWSRSTSPPCDTAASNNVMDYNALQNAYTPCQVGRIRRQLATPGQRTRAYVLPRWNELPTSQPLIIRDTVVWAAAKDLKSNLVIEAGGQLRVSCRLGMPRNSYLRIQPGGTLILEDALLHHPGKYSWQGIQIGQLGKTKGRLLMNGQSQIQDAIHPISPPEPSDR